MGEKQHYVPRFYLRNFSEMEGAVRMYNINDDRIIHEASIKGQCQKSYMYGRNEILEGIISDFESEVAPVIKKYLVEKRKIPFRKKEEMSYIIFFIALQMVRTEYQEKMVNRGIDAMYKSVAREDPRFDDYDLSKYKVKTDKAILLALSSLNVCAEGIWDLRFDVLESGRTEEFITSDNPVFRYNQYKEDIPECPGTGVVESGIQIFAPFSPNYSVIAYDEDIYRLKNRERGAKKISSRDTRTMNKIQAVNADENIYFYSRSMGTSVRKAVKSVRGKREVEGVETTEFRNVDDPNEKLVRHHHKIPNLKLNLSFLETRTNARRVPVYDRRELLRKPPPEPPEEIDKPDPPKTGGHYRRVEE